LQNLSSISSCGFFSGEPISTATTTNKIDKPIFIKIKQIEEIKQQMAPSQGGESIRKRLTTATTKKDNAPVARSTYGTVSTFHRGDWT
jgi:hypothetical protein